MMNWKKLLYVLIIFCILLTFGATYSNDDTVDYAVTQMARSNETLFTKDFVAVADSSTFTPKFFNDLLMVFLINLGCTWMAASLTIYLVSALILSVGIVEIAYAISDRHVLVTAVFIELAIMYMTVGKDFGMNYIWRTSFTMQSFSMSLIVLSLGYALRPNVKFWQPSLLLVLSVMFNVQLGVYASIIIGIIFITRYGYRTMPWLLAPLALAVLMFVMVSMRSESILENKEFIEIYAKMRNPHHLAPSHWDISGMLSYGGHMVALFILACVVHKGDIKRHYNISIISFTQSIVNIKVVQ